MDAVCPEFLIDWGISWDEKKKAGMGTYKEISFTALKFVFDRSRAKSSAWSGELSAYKKGEGLELYWRNIFESDTVDDFGWASVTTLF